MHCSNQFRILLLTAAFLLPCPALPFARGAQTQDQPQTSGTEVRLHWGARPGISRYRLQLASDTGFTDIVFDRVVSGTEYRVNDLAPGKYFWRISALTDKAGDFSSAGVVEVASATLDQPRVPPVATRAITKTEPNVSARGGWRAAIGDVTYPLLAHLRSPDTVDLLGINSDGVLYALDSATGVAIWSTGKKRSSSNLTRLVPGCSPVFLSRDRKGLDHPILLSGNTAIALEGKTGRELWRSNLPAAASCGVVSSEAQSARIFVVDNSGLRVTVLDAKNGNILTQIRLPQRVRVAPVVLPGSARIVLAYETSLIEIRDSSGALIRSGDTGSPATTAPLFVQSRGSELILIGTTGGLTALTADDLRPLGMVASKNDAPRGMLAAADLDGDGSPEVIMMTDRGRVIAVSAVDGKPIWEAGVSNESESVAFADVDGDRVLDVLIAGGQNFAMALSGRNGAVIWQDNEGPPLVSNHSVSFAPRALVTMPYRDGVLLIGGDQSHMSLRALEFPNANTRRLR